MNYTIWVVGVMFTVGYMQDVIAQAIEKFGYFGMIIATLLFWPVMLGAEIAK